MEFRSGGNVLFGLDAPLYMQIFGSARLIFPWGVLIGLEENTEGNGVSREGVIGGGHYHLLR